MRVFVRTCVREGVCKRMKSICLHENEPVFVASTKRKSRYARTNTHLPSEVTCPNIFAGSKLQPYAQEPVPASPSSSPHHFVAVSEVDRARPGVMFV